MNATQLPQLSSTSSNYRHATSIVWNGVQGGLELEGERLLEGGVVLFQHTTHTTNKRSKVHHPVRTEWRKAKRSATLVWVRLR